MTGEVVASHPAPDDARPDDGTVVHDAVDGAPGGRVSAADLDDDAVLRLGTAGST
jgi:hypothetical protein